MIKNLFYISLIFTIISWFILSSTHFLPLKVYKTEVLILNSQKASKIYRDIEEYFKSLSEEEKKYTKINKIGPKDELIVNRSYELVVIGTVEEKDFLQSKVNPAFYKKGFSLTLVPIENNKYLDYLSNYKFKSLYPLDENKLDKINEKFLESIKNNKMIDYIEFLKNYFSETDAKKIAETQFFISQSSISLLNFLLYPYTTSKKIKVNKIEINNIASKEIYNHIQYQILKIDKNKDKDILKVQNKIRIVSIRGLDKELKSEKSKTKK